VHAAAIAQALEGCSSQRSSSGSHTITPSNRPRKPAAPKPKAQPKPRPATTPKAIKTYVPEPKLGTSKPEIVRSTSSDDGGTSPWPFIAGGLAAIALGAGGYLLARRRRAT